MSASLVFIKVHEEVTRSTRVVGIKSQPSLFRTISDVSVKKANPAIRMRILNAAFHSVFSDSEDTSVFEIPGRNLPSGRFAYDCLPQFF